MMGAGVCLCATFCSHTSCGRKDCRANRGQSLHARTLCWPKHPCTPLQIFLPVSTFPTGLAMHLHAHVSFTSPPPPPPPPPHRHLHLAIMSSGLLLTKFSCWYGASFPVSGFQQCLLSSAQLSAAFLTCNVSILCAIWQELSMLTEAMPRSPLAFLGVAFLRSTAFCLAGLAAGTTPNLQAASCGLQAGCP